MRTLTLAILMLSLAAGWSVHAADSKYKRQQVEADQLYTSGEFQKAMREYLPLAKKGDSFSQYRVSFMYVEGQGVEADLVEAYAWASLAAQNYQPELVRYRDTVASLIPEKDRRKAVRQADYYNRKWGNIALADDAYRGTTKQLRSCTGSRLGARCEDIESAEMPTVWGINPGNGSSAGGGDGGDGGGASASGSVADAQGKPGSGSPRDVAYYQNLRASIKEMNNYIEQNSGTVTLGELKVIEDDQDQASPDKAANPEEIPDSGEK